MLRYGVRIAVAPRFVLNCAVAVAPTRGFHAAGMPHAGNQQHFSGVNKSNKYVNTNTSAAPIHTACGRRFDPMLFQELLQASSDPGWSAAIQRNLKDDAEYVAMLRTDGGGAMAIDELCLHGLGGSDEEAMGNLKKLLQSDRRAALSVCAIQDSYVKIREKRDVEQSKIAAEGGHDAYSSLRQNRTPFGANTGS